MKRATVNETTLLTKGWKALVKTLGLAGATRFLLAVEHGRGDSVKELRTWRDRTSFQGVLKALKISKAA